MILIKTKTMDHTEVTKTMDHTEAMEIMAHMEVTGITEATKAMIMGI